ncbi:MAG: Type 1 glutamine amidotransferase-like domain-containing protein [Gemmatimonadales bacterium]
MRRSNFLSKLFSFAIGLVPAAAAAQNGGTGAPRVGPPRGTVVVVGGGQIGPRVWAEFIEAAGGPDALIIDVPTAGGDSTYPSDWRGRDGLLAAGAKNVVVLHTIDRNVADADSFAAILRRAGRVVRGGQQWHLVDSYAGTRTERAFHDVLARGGVVGGSSAGASILASYLLRGARSGNSIVMDPEYDRGFGFLRGTAIDQHVVARDRLPTSRTPDPAAARPPRHLGGRGHRLGGSGGHGHHRGPQQGLRLRRAGP